MDFEWTSQANLGVLNDPIDIALAKYNSHPSILKIREHVLNPVTIDFNEISEDDIKNIFSKFDTKKGTSFNSVSGKILKENGNIYYDTLTKTVNNSINKNNYPYRLKFADTNPTIKPGKKDRTDIGNYRPISVLPYASKLFERLMKN